MTKQSIDYKSYAEKIKGFKQIGWIENKLQMAKRPNFWTILEFGEKEVAQGKSAHETRTSRMIRWLLDANANHNLGNIFAQKFVELLEGDYSYSSAQNKVIKCIAEYENIDVLYQDFSQNMCLAIEVKQFAKEGKSTGFDSQLDKYEGIVESLIQQNGSDIRPYYIFLTPLGEQPSNKKWQPVSYEQFITIIDDVCDAYVADVPYKEDTLKILADFKEDLQRTLDIFEIDASAIKEKLTQEERNLTMALANEIEHETETEHLDQLLAFEQDDSTELQDIIMIIKDYMHTQNHTPNVGVRVLMRKIYNYLSAERQLNTEQIVEYKKDETLTPLKQDIIDRYQLNIGEIALTARGGQGLFMYAKDRSYAIYFSGDTHGHFPNDGIQLLVYPNKKKIKVDKTISKKEFRIDATRIMQNELTHKSGKTLDVEQLMEQYVLNVVQELDGRMQSIAVQ